MTGTGRTGGPASQGTAGSPDARTARATYEAWAPRYDAENLGAGFRLPFVATSLLARHLPPGGGSILDGACGTGLVGESLGLLGYGGLVGVDCRRGWCRPRDATRPTRRW